MKLRKTVFAALGLAPLMLFAGCTSTSALTFSANWYANTNTSSNITGTSEELVYSVTFRPSEDSSNFSAAYEQGTYTVTLEDVTSTAEAPIEGVPVGFHGYHLHSELKISGKYTWKGVDGDKFDDFTRSDIWFTSLSDDTPLRPVRSVKTVHSTTPNVQTSSITTVGILYYYTYTVAYEEDMKSATITYDDLTDINDDSEHTVKLSGGGTFLDNEQILFALRGLDMSASFTFRTINPVSNKGTTKLSSDETPVTESTTMTFAINGESAERTLEANRVSIRYDGINTGKAQTLTYAKRTSTESNTYRNVLLTLETYGLESLGSFFYQLTSATFNTK